MQAPVVNYILDLDLKKLSIKDVIMYVNVKNFLTVLLGDKKYVSGGSGKVVDSGPDNHIFIFYSNHGSPGVIYLEACESESIFEGFLPENISIYATTASNVVEISLVSTRKKIFLFIDSNPTNDNSIFIEDNSLPFTPSVVNQHNADLVYYWHKFYYSPKESSKKLDVEKKQLDIITLKFTLVVHNLLPLFRKFFLRPNIIQALEHIVGLEIDHKVKNAYLLILNAIVYFIWVERNSRRFNAKTVCAIITMSKKITRAIYLKLDKWKDFPYSIHQLERDLFDVGFGFKQAQAPVVNYILNIGLRKFMIKDAILSPQRIWRIREKKLVKKKDYVGDDVNVKNFLVVLLGDKKYVSSGSGKVVDSGSDDHIFIFYSDHGSPGIIYLETCESGSIFEGILSKDISIATTTSNAVENSWRT
ncbi:hypothetical protein M5K25_022549 [Dendrobium thyrsiflorum]|uniref:Uncharacterized protein n=1 Tax=Dendrobium thyrsiflorum TaxID=117978 RepID=A0ABD0U6H5_DENTH